MIILISFILGILSVLLMASMVLGVLAFVKVNKLNKDFKSEIHHIDNRFGSHYKLLSEQNKQLEKFSEISDSINSKYDDVYREFDNVYREIDSRLDKLDNKLSTRFKVKQIIND